MTNAANNPYELTSELIAAKDAVIAAKQIAARLRQRVDEAAASLTALKTDIGVMTNELAEKEAERALAEDDQTKLIDAEIKKLADRLDSKIRDLNRTNNLIQTLEAKAPEIDGAVNNARDQLRMERGYWIEPIIESLRDELELACRPLLGVLAKAKALGHGNSQLQDMLIAAWVPDPSGFMIGHDGMNTYNRGRNILDTPPDEQQRAAAQAISEVLFPIDRHMSEHHPEYIPLVRRQPYVRKGIVFETRTPTSDVVRHS